MTPNEQKRAEEVSAVERAKAEAKPVTFISEVDGCEVTVTPVGDILYNAADWY